MTTINRKKRCANRTLSQSKKVSFNNTIIIHDDTDIVSIAYDELVNSYLNIGGTMSCEELIIYIKGRFKSISAYPEDNDKFVEFYNDVQGRVMDLIDRIVIAHTRKMEYKKSYLIKSVFCKPPIPYIINQKPTPTPTPKPKPEEYTVKLIESSQVDIPSEICVYPPEFNGLVPVLYEGGGSNRYIEYNGISILYHLIIAMNMVRHTCYEFMDDRKPSACDARITQTKFASRSERA
ncbi:MAG: hypothetical protein Gaeavirus11_5 [Gaeavirus sp.]|uniref:Uncharacterized protein n=1 Tax=Gaeavirus sp. TaxID=2487767 RepID=A0A3G4ZYX4_9VIRU|nr:MAG: hypothetical protein Gaeavirus11_5 [Gaeavirus sp.]